MPDFLLDPRLDADTTAVAELELCTLRLARDARFPWLILVPKRAGMAEMIDLEAMDRAILFDEIMLVSRALQAATRCHKLNVAALGNQVRQLHVHVIARFETDAAWPRPVWGTGEPVAYEPAARDRLIAALRETLPPSCPAVSMASFFDGLPTTEASSRHGFSGNRIERRSEKRDEDAVPTALADRNARLYLFRGENALLRTDGASGPLFTLAEADAIGADRAGIILLGWTERGPRLAATVPDVTPIDDAAYRLVDLRSLAIEGTLAAEDLGAMAQARSLCNWHLRHGHCSVCGQPSAMKIGGYRRDCPNCGAQHFPRTDPVVIMLAIDSAGDRALLGRQARFAPGMYSCLAGFVEPGETIEDAVRRETQEEAGIRVGRVRYHSSQPWPFPSSLMIGCHAEALSTEIHRDEVELEACRWFGREEVRTMIAGTHPEGLKCPPGIAIASHIIRAWAEGG